jgi:hypothetical protein
MTNNLLNATWYNSHGTPKVIIRKKMNGMLDSHQAAKVPAVEPDECDRL